MPRRAGGTGSAVLSGRSRSISIVRSHPSTRYWRDINLEAALRLLRDRGFMIPIPSASHNSSRISPPNRVSISISISSTTTENSSEHSELGRGTAEVTALRSSLLRPEDSAATWARSWNPDATNSVLLDWGRRHARAYLYFMAAFRRNSVLSRPRCKSRKATHTPHRPLCR